MIRSLILAIALAFAAVPALAAEVYTGTIGDEAVVVLLRRQDAEVTGVFAYRAVGRSVSIVGRGTGDTLTLQNQMEGQPPTGLWRLTSRGETLTGTWQANAGAAAQPVSLRRIANPPDYTTPPEGWRSQYVSASGLPAGWEDDDRPYVLELAREPVILGGELLVDGAAYRMATDPRTSVAWPRLTGLANAGAMARLNAVFEVNRALAIADVLDCHADREAAQPAAPDPTAPTARITYVGPRMISLVIDGNMDCGGAPEGFHRIVVYDIATATPVIVSNFLRLDTSAEQSAFQRFWVGRMRARLAGGPPMGDCFDFGEDDAPPIALRPSLRGLVIERAAQLSMDVPCAVELVEIPLADLAPYLRGGSAGHWQ